MTCPHINKAKAMITNLISDEKKYEKKAYLTPEKVKKFTHGKLYNSSIEEIEQLSDKCDIVNKEYLEDKLQEIKLVLSQCKCLEEEKSKGKLNSKVKEIDSKNKELGRIVEKNDCGKEVFRLRNSYNLLENYKKDNSKTEIKRVMEDITDVSGSLIEKGVSFNDVDEIGKICERVAKLNLEVELEEQKQEEYQARVEFSTNNK